MSIALKHIEKYNALNGKRLNSDNVFKVLKALQKDIESKAIRKNDAYAKDIVWIQNKLVKLTNSLNCKKVVLKIDLIQIESDDNHLLHGLECLQDDSHLEGETLGSTQSVYDFITKMVIDRIKKGGLVWRKPWNADNYDGLPAMNYISKKRYKGINAVMLNFTESENPFFMTFNQIKNHKTAKLKKGVSAYPVIYYTMLFKDLKGNKIAEGQVKKLKRGEYQTIPIVRFYNVFNGDDVTGIDWKVKNVKTIDFKDISTAKIIVDRMPKRPPIKHQGARAFYSENKSITMPPKKFFDSETAYYGTLFHELVHSTGHSSRVGRSMEGSFGSKGYAFEELIAELGASFLCGDAGILYHTLDNTASYIKGWESKLIGHLEDDNRFIFKASAEAQKAADFILDGKEYIFKSTGLKAKSTANRKPIKPKEKSAKKPAQTELFAGLSGLPEGFIRADQTVKDLPDTFTLPGEVGKLLGKLQRYKLAISLTGDYHGGKSEFAKQLINAFIAKRLTVGLFDLEQGGLPSKDTRQSIDRNITKKHQKSLAVTGEAESGLNTIKQYAKAFDVVVIDSWQKFDEPSTRFDELRKEFPNTIFVVIFQQNAEGGTRGGSASDFDAPVALKANRIDPYDFTKNYVSIKKNRGNRTNLIYYIAAKKTKEIEGLLTPKEDD